MSLLAKCGLSTRAALCGPFLLGQALSLVRARQTLQWRSSQDVAGEPTYDALAINNQLGAIAGQEARWRLYFARNGIVPLRLEYEDLVADPQRAVSAIAALMGLAEAPKVVTASANSAQRVNATGTRRGNLGLMDSFSCGRDDDRPRRTRQSHCVQIWRHFGLKAWENGVTHPTTAHAAR